MLLPGCLVQDAWNRSMINIKNENEIKQMCILQIEAAMFCLQIILPIQTSSNILPPQVNSPTPKQLPTDVILWADGKVYLSPLPISSHHGFGIDLSKFLWLLGRDAEIVLQEKLHKKALSWLKYMLHFWWGFYEPMDAFFNKVIYTLPPASARMTAASVDWDEVVTFPLRNWLSHHLSLPIFDIIVQETEGHHDVYLNIL